MKTKDVKLLRDGIRELIKQLEKSSDNRDIQQVEAFNAMVSDNFTDEQIAHSYFKLPTGFGKTVMFVRMARAYFDALKSAGEKQQKVIIIVPRISLIDQTKKQLKEFANITAMEYSNRSKDVSGDVVITTYHSLPKLFDPVSFNDVGLIIADEAHHMLGEKISKILLSCNQYVPVIGFTATPEYDTNSAVANMLNTEIYAMDIPEAIRKGILCPVKNILFRSNIVCDLSNISVKQGSGEYDYGKIISEIDPDALITEIARIYTDGFDEDTGIKFNQLKVIINCPNSEIANRQAAKINEIMGHKAAVSLHKVGISNKEYERLKEGFETGEYNVACQVGTLTEGFDNSTVSMCINYPTHSRVKAEQTAGRTMRINKSNPDKVAFVIDVLFRKNKHEAEEDIIYNAAKAHQVLFNDVADDYMVLYLRDFMKQLKLLSNDKNADLITSGKELQRLKRIAMARLEKDNGIEGYKTKEWMSAGNLAKDPTFPCKDVALINKKLNDLRPDMGEFIQFKKMRKSGTSIICLHRDAKEDFADIASFDLTKTSEWLSVGDLVKGKFLPISSSVVIYKKMQLLQPKMPKFIQTRLSKRRMPVLCLCRNVVEAFYQEAKDTFLPIEPGWMSPDDLAFDPTFPKNDVYRISKKLKELQPEMPNLIQKQKLKIGGWDFCLRQDARERFLVKIGYYDSIGVQYKTHEWLSAKELAKDPTFPSKNAGLIGDKLKELRHKMGNQIQFLVSRSKSKALVLCLHRDAKEKFATLAGFSDKKEIIRTKEWVSASDLVKDKNFPVKNSSSVHKKMQLLQPEMPSSIQIRIITRGETSHMPVLCLRRDAVKEFCKNARKICLPIKDGWLSADDLVFDPDCPIRDVYRINKKLTQLQSKMPDIIQRQNLKLGGWDYCVRRDNLERFYGLIKKEKSGSLQDGTRVVSANTDFNQTVNTIKSVADTTTHKK